MLLQILDQVYKNSSNQCCADCRSPGSVCYLRNRRWGGSVYVLQMFFSVFFVFFCFFSIRKNIMRQPFSGMAERIFMKFLPNDTGESGVCNIVPPPGEWRMLMICVVYAMTLAQSPEGATHGSCVINHERANGFNLVITYYLIFFEANPARFSHVVLFF